MNARPASLDIRQTIGWLYELRNQLPMFVVTDHPTDWPDFYVARLHVTIPKPEASSFAIMDDSLDNLRITLEALGLTHLDRSPGDEPHILEIWL